jgi:hypothetical protein
MLLIFQVQERPQLFIAPDDDMSSPSSVTTIRPTLPGELIAVQMRRTCPPLARAAKDLYIVNEVGIGHLLQ